MGREYTGGVGMRGCGDVGHPFPYVPTSPRRLWLEEEALQRPGSRDVTQPSQCLFLDLADPLARDAQQRADLFEGHRLLPFEAEVEPQDLRLAVLEIGRASCRERV